MGFAFLTLAFICNAAANILLKLAALQKFSFADALRGQWTLATLEAGAAVGLFALNLVFYLLALERIPLSIGYPIMVGMTFFITIGASLLLGERISASHAAGMALILLGILLIVRFSGS